MACKEFDWWTFDKEEIFDNLKEVQRFIVDADLSKQCSDEYMEQLNDMIETLHCDMNRLKEYCDMSRDQLEEIRQPIKEACDKINKKITESTDKRMEIEKSAEICMLEIREKRLKTILAKLSSDLTRASKLNADTENAALSVQRDCLETVEMARRLKAELAEKKRLEMEEARRLEAERLAEIERLAELARIAKEEEARELELIRLREEEAYLWPIFAIHMPSVWDFDGGIGCVVKADPEFLRDGDISVEVVENVDVIYDFVDSEELVSNIVRIYMPDNPCNDSRIMMKSNMCISIPHCIARTQLAYREPIVKLMKGPGVWADLKTRETTLEGYKDTRFAQAETLFLGTFMIVSRFKRDVLRLRRTGGSVTSSVDARFSITATTRTFNKEEKVQVEMKQIDSTLMNELRLRLPTAKNLFSVSPFISMNWTNVRFKRPLTLSIPLPPNSEVLRQMLAMKKLKEEKNKTEESDSEEDEHDVNVSAKKEKREKKTGAMSISSSKMDMHKKSVREPEKAERRWKPATLGLNQKSERTAAADKKDKRDREEDGDQGDFDAPGGLSNKPMHWYMGQYSQSSDATQENVFIFSKKKNRWALEPLVYDASKLDLLEIRMVEPLQQMIAFRVAPSVVPKEAEEMANILWDLLPEKVVKFVILQEQDNLFNVIASVVPVVRLERFLEKYAHRNFHVGPKLESHFCVREGDILDISFRGNIKRVPDKDFKPIKMFNANFEFKFCMTLVESDIFVQRSYDVYRGFVQLRHLTFELKMFEEKVNFKESDTTLTASSLDLQDEERADNTRDDPLTDNTLKKSMIAARSSMGYGLKCTFSANVVNELLVVLPKNMSALISKPLVKANVTYVDDRDSLKTDMVVNLAYELTVDWPVAAVHLGVSSVMIQMLQRNGELNQMSGGRLALQMLMLWIKTRPRSQNKTKSLYDALKEIQKPHLYNIFDPKRFMSNADSLASIGNFG